ncbi:MAG: YbhN family protein [Pseudomonadota bacterium]
MARLKRGGARVPSGRFRLGHTVFGCAAFVLIWWLFSQRIAEVEWASVPAALASVAPLTVLLALGLAGLSYAAMAAYDVIAVEMLGHRVPARRAMRAGFTATALGQTLGLAVVVGSAVRWRHYRRHGLGPGACSILTGTVSSGFMLALALVFAIFLWSEAGRLAPIAGLSPEAATTLSVAILASGVALFLLSWMRPRIGRWRVPVPPLAPLLRMGALALIDILPAAAILWLLLGSGVTYAEVLPVFAVALGLSLLANTPGGIGTYEVVCLTAWPALGEEQVLAALILFRVIFYVLPAAVAATLLFFDTGAPNTRENTAST